MRQLPTIIIIFILSSFQILFGQEEKDEKTTVDYERIFSQKEIDSIVNTLRGYFYNSNYEKIILEVPSLLKYRSLAESSMVGGGLRSVLGNSLIQLDDIEGAAEIFSEALAEAQDKKDTLNIMSSYLNLGNTYITAIPDKAITYFKSGLAIANDHPQSEFVVFILHNNLAELYVGTKDAKRAQYHLDKALAISTHPSLSERKIPAIATIHYVQGAIHLLNQEFEKSIASTLKSLDIGKREGIDDNYVLNNYKNLLDAYDSTGQLGKLNVIRKKYDSLRNKRYEADKILQQQIARSKFKLDKYQQELRASQLENELTKQKASQNKSLLIYGGIFGSILVIAVGALLFSRSRRYKLLKDLRVKNTQYLQAKEKSEKLAKSNTKFLSTISHELRTPLYGIVGLSSVLLKNKELEEHQEDLHALKFSADYLLALVNDVLNLNKLESKAGQELQKNPFNLKILVQSIIQSFVFINKQNNNKVTATIDPTIPDFLVCDKTKVAQVLMNLISNASKFTEDGSIEIRVSAQSMDDHEVQLLFSVKDTGLGIPEDEQQKIFEEFTQVDTTHQSGGTGLGLPIVNKILNILGSKLSLESKPGQGSTFFFY